MLYFGKSWYNIHMLVVSFFQWWYVRGWLDFIHNLGSRLGNLADSFSISLLLRTLFSPYKQISAYGSGGDSFQGQISDFFDRLLSRIIGAIFRLLIIFSGIIVMLGGAIVSLLLIIIWPLLPLLPIVSVVLAILGVGV